MQDDHNAKPHGPEVIGEKFSFTLPPVPGHFVRAAVLLGIVGLAIFIACATCMSYIHPNECGIKETKIGVHRGIQEKIYEPGLVFLLPFGMEKMYRFPRNIQTLELTAFPTEAAKEGTNRFSDKAAKIQTSDGFYVDVDVTILYQIVDAYKLITSVGPGQLYLYSGILPKAEPILKQAFGGMTTEDFYGQTRVEKAENARELLNAEMKDKGMQVDQVLVRYFKYSDEIQKSIEEKKLQDQLVFKNQSQAKAATEEANLKRVQQEGEMQVKVTLQEGEAYRINKKGETDLYARQKEAEADLLVKLAEAKRTELKNEAMQQAGADKMVAQKMAQVLGGIDTIIIPSGGASGINPLDLDKMLKLFGADITSAPPKAASPAASPPPPPPPPTPVVAPAAPVVAAPAAAPAQPEVTK